MTFVATPAADTRYPFSIALAAIKAGARVQRTGWNGKDMWVDLEPGRGANLPYLTLNYPPGPVYPNGARVPWLASQTDILSDDWLVLVEP